MVNIYVKVDKELAELIPQFIKNRADDIKSLRERLLKGDYELIERIGHGMKGAGGGFGFDGITEIGARIEKAAKNKNFDETQKEIEGLSDYMKNLEVVYE